MPSIHTLVLFFACLFFSAALRTDEVTILPTDLPTDVPTIEVPTPTCTTVVASPTETQVPTPEATQTSAVPSETPTYTLEATITATPTITPTLIIGSTANLTATNTVSPTATMAEPTATLTPLPPLRIETGQRAFASESRLKALIKSMRGEKTIATFYDGKLRRSERWTMVYRWPDECLFKVHDSAGRLLLTRLFRGTTVTVAAGAMRESYTTKEPLAWSRVVDFFDLRLAPEEVRDFRELQPGDWIPNTSEAPIGWLPPGAALRLKTRRTLDSVLINAEVDRDLETGGY